MKLEHRKNRGKNNHALYSRSSWTGPDSACRTRKRTSSNDHVRNETGVDDEIPTPSHSVKPSSSPARKKLNSTEGATRKGKGKLKSKRRRKNVTKNCHVTDRSGSRVDVDVNLTDQAKQQSNGNSCVVSNFCPSY